MSTTETRDLLLYQTQYCPYCIKVRRYMEANGIELPTKDVQQEPEARRELLTLGGKTQVPALRIDGQILYESDDIIHWLGEHIIPA